MGEITCVINLQEYKLQDTLAPYYRYRRCAIDFYNLGT